MDKPVGFLGGTGIEGKGLALRFALAGVPVVIGSRSEERARSAAQEYNTFLGKPLLRGMVNRDMLASAGIVFLTVPADHAVAAVEACRDDFPSGLILVDVTVPTQIKEGRVEYLERKEGSNAELIAAHLPDRVRLVGAFKTVPAWSRFSPRRISLSLSLRETISSGLACTSVPIWTLSPTRWPAWRTRNAVGAFAGTRFTRSRACKSWAATPGFSLETAIWQRTFTAPRPCSGGRV